MTANGVAQTEIQSWLYVAALFLVLLLILFIADMRKRHSFWATRQRRKYLERGTQGSDEANSPRIPRKSPPK